MNNSKRQEFIHKFVANSPAGVGVLNSHSRDIAFAMIWEMMLKFPELGNHLKSEKPKEIKTLIEGKEMILQDFAVATTIAQQYILQEMKSLAYLKGKHGLKG